MSAASISIEISLITLCGTFESCLVARESLVKMMLRHAPSDAIRTPPIMSRYIALLHAVRFNHTLRY